MPYLYTDGTVEPLIKDTPIRGTIEITSEQRTSFNVSNGNFPIVLIHYKGQPHNKGQNGQKTMGPKRGDSTVSICSLIIH